MGFLADSMYCAVQSYEIVLYFTAVNYPTASRVHLRNRNEPFKWSLTFEVVIRQTLFADKQMMGSNHKLSKT